MHDPELYKRANEMQRQDAKETIDEFWHMIHWRKDGWDAVLDIGCGSADVTWDYILPALPNTFQRLVGVDSSEEMIEFARSQYSNPRVSFKKLDIGIDLKDQNFRDEPFDHITSFYCLNWVQDQKCAIRNMYQLLKPGGDMLVGLLVKNPIYDIYKEMSRDERWSQHMTDVNQYISPYHYSENPVDEFRKLLSSNGFIENWVQTRDKSFVFEGMGKWKAAWTAVNPWYDRIPAQEQEAYWECFLNGCAKRGYCLDYSQRNNKDCRFMDPYKWMIAWAKRP